MSLSSGHRERGEALRKGGEETAEEYWDGAVTVTPSSLRPARASSRPTGSWWSSFLCRSGTGVRCLRLPVRQWRVPLGGGRGAGGGRTPLPEEEGGRGGGQQETSSLVHQPRGEEHRTLEHSPWDLRGCTGPGVDRSTGGAGRGGDRSTGGAEEGGRVDPGGDSLGALPEEVRSTGVQPCQG